MLKVALVFDQLVSHGVDPDSALAQLRLQPDVYDLEIVSALEGFPVRPAECHPRALPVHELDAHMILDQDVHARSGNLLVTKGQELTFPVLERLRRWARGVGVEEPVRVLVPRYQSKDEPAEVGATPQQAP